MSIQSFKLNTFKIAAQPDRGDQGTTGRLCIGVPCIPHTPVLLDKLNDSNVESTGRAGDAQYFHARK